MITEIYLVRHAHSEYSSGNEETRGLSERGRNDALTVTKLLSQENVQVVCSSPYARAIQTVERIASILGCRRTWTNGFENEISLNSATLWRTAWRQWKEVLWNPISRSQVANRIETLNYEELVR